MILSPNSSPEKNKLLRFSTEVLEKMAHENRDNTAYAAHITLRERQARGLIQEPPGQETIQSQTEVNKEKEVTATASIVDEEVRSTIADNTKTQPIREVAATEQITLSGLDINAIRDRLSDLFDQEKEAA